MMAYVIQDWLGLFHIVNETVPMQELRNPAQWIVTTKTETDIAKNTFELKRKLKERGVDTFLLYSCQLESKRTHFVEEL